jgi:uncharacterized protein YkwD
MVLIILFIAFFGWLAISYKHIKRKSFATPYPIEFEGLDLEFVELVNEYRQSKGLDVLEGALNLTEIAEAHVNWMVENGLSHEGFVDRQFEANAKAFAEILCPKRNTAYSYFMSYIGSDDHKKAIEKNDVTHIGIYTHDNGLQCVLFAGY